jgi:HEPN domain-containing protein
MGFMRKLAPQYVTTRYPDAAYGTPDEIYDKEIADEYIAKTEEVMIWLKQKLAK